jgi:putative ABC transport system permease protein
LVNGVLLKPLPYPNADRLFHLYHTVKTDNTNPFDYPDFADYCASQHSFAALAAYTLDWFHLSSRDSTDQIPGLYVSGAFFRVMGRPVILGRPLDEADDRPGSAAVAVLSENLWRTHFNADPNIIGATIGIVPAIQHDRPDFPHAPHQAYFLYFQSPYAPRITNDFTLLLHTRDNPLALINALRRTVAGIDPNLPLTSIYPFDQVIYDSFASRRLQMTLVGVFSAAALVLAVVGLYGVLSYSVSLRKRELSVRIALGAQASSILGLVVGQGLKIAGIGLMVGLISALTLNYLIEWALFGVSAADPISFGASVLVLAAAALLPCLLPALRATRIDPIRTLRE